MANRILVKNGKILSTNNEILVSNLEVPEGELEINVNGTYDVSNYASVKVDVTIDDRLTELANQKGGAGLFMHYQGNDLEYYLRGLDFSNTTSKSATYMFQNCKAQYVPDFDIGNMENGDYMFSNMANLIIQPNIRYEQLTRQAGIFQSCPKITKININSNNSTSLNYAFGFCNLLEELVISSMDKCTSSSSLNGLCQDNYSLKKIVIEDMSLVPPLSSNSFRNCYHFTGTYHKTYNPESLKDGHIYCPTKWVEQLKQATNWSVYADIIVPKDFLNQNFSDIDDQYFMKSETRNLIMYLKDFNNIPNVSIISSDNNIVSISNTIINKDKIMFDISSTGNDGNAEITINVNGDYDFTYRFEVKNKKLVQPTYNVESIENVEYGFELNSEGYYESGNKGIDNSYSLCKVNINNSNYIEVNMILDCINYAESSWDYGILSNLDTTLEKNNKLDGTNVYKSFKSLSSNSVQQVTYNLPAGEHFIFVKYIKDGSGSNGNDSFQFKIRFEGKAEQFAKQQIKKADN